MTDPARTSPPATASAAAASSTTAAPVAPKPAAKAVKPRGIRQTMSDLHTWAGLLVGWILYAMFLTGTVAYFRDEMSHWMRPELPAAAAQAQDAAALAQRLVDSTTQTLAPHAQQLSIRLPTARDPSASVYWRTPAPRAQPQAPTPVAALKPPYSTRAPAKPSTHGPPKGEIFSTSSTSIFITCTRSGPLDCGVLRHVHAGGHHQRGDHP